MLSVRRQGLEKRRKIPIDHKEVSFPHSFYFTPSFLFDGLYVSFIASVTMSYRHLRRTSDFIRRVGLGAKYFFFGSQGECDIPLLSLLFRYL